MERQKKSNPKNECRMEIIMSISPLISIIVTVYNVEKYLEECLDSLIAQDYDNMEIILVDDGSTDTTGKICDRYAQSNSKIQVLHKENGGLVSAWRAGVNESKGEYLCFVDGDDWVDKDMLTQLSAFCSQSDNEIICSDYIIERINGNNTFCYQGLRPGEYLGESLENDIKPDLLGNEIRLIHFSRCMKLISRDLFIRNMHYPEDRMTMGEDLTVTLPCLLEAERICVLDHRAMYHYRLVDTSMAHKYDANLLQKVNTLYEVTKRVVLEKNPSLMEKALSEYVFLLLLCVKNEIRGNGLGIIESIKKIKELKANPGVDEAVRRASIRINDKSNALLYMVLKNPNVISVGILKLAFKIYYR